MATNRKSLLAHHHILSSVFPYLILVTSELCAIGLARGSIINAKLKSGNEQPCLVTLEIKKEKHIIYKDSSLD